MTKENDLLRGIVMRQLKDQARRVQARDLLTDELKRLDVQSDELNKQVEELGRPTTQLTDEERALVQGPAGHDLGRHEQPDRWPWSSPRVKPKGPGASTSRRRPRR